MNPTALDHPANAGLRRRFGARELRPELPPLASPAQIEQPYMALGTHPDLVARLWDELPTELPVDCRAVVYGTPALMRPTTGIVFGFANGTHTYALRLPELDRAEAIRAGATRVTHHTGGQPSSDLEDLGPEWVFCRWLPDERAWCRAAYEFASVG